MDITTVKRGITRKYIGKHGIHGCGIRKEEGKEYITVIHVPEEPLTHELELLIMADAAPFEVKFFAEGRAYAR